MTDSEDFYVRFWGVRGSIATPGPRTSRYGGNTSALEVRCGKHMLLFDAGTGLRYLGNELLKSGPVDTDLFLTHTHFDHVCGLPFFVPLFIKTSQIRIWAGHLKAREMTVKYVISEMMFSPLFPVPPEIFTASRSPRGLDMVARTGDWWFVDFDKTSSTPDEYFANVRRAIEDMRGRARREGRTVRLGLGRSAALAGGFEDGACLPKSIVGRISRAHQSSRDGIDFRSKWSSISAQEGSIWFAR